MGKTGNVIFLFLCFVWIKKKSRVRNLVMEDLVIACRKLSDPSSFFGHMFQIWYRSLITVPQKIVFSTRDNLTVISSVVDKIKMRSVNINRKKAICGSFNFLSPLCVGVVFTSFEILVIFSNLFYIKQNFYDCLRYFLRVYKYVTTF